VGLLAAFQKKKKIIKKNVLIRASHRNKKPFRSSAKNANSAPEVWKTVATVDRRNYI